MSRRIPKPKTCTLCGRAVVNSFICRRCGKELRDLLIGSSEPDGQPGIVWYIQRLRETAYRQARMDCSLGAKSSHHGYYLFGDARALVLLRRISLTLARWDSDLSALIEPQRRNHPLMRVLVAGRGSDGLDEARSRRLAEHIPALRHNCGQVRTLHGDLLEYAKQAWRIINRPNDICCGPCPASACGTLLYAEEHAETVQCPKCRAEHDVCALREELKRITRDMLFTGPELLRLMETRLNDRITKTAFYQLIRDGRLAYRGINAEGLMCYTYADVLEARAKESPHRRVHA
jgi:hypothetical protein